MNPSTAFFKLIRWQNLFFIILTQALFYRFILRFVYGGNILPLHHYLNTTHFILVTAASLCIAAAGYIINDYFDINIDQVNKPDQIIIGKYINRRWAIVFHWLLSFTGFLLSCYAGYLLRNIYIPVLNLFSIALLWFYSTTFKKKILAGNVIISLLTAWVILILTVAEYGLQKHVHVNSFISSRLLKVSFIYAGFAFVISLIREVVKDMEDMDGDARYNCKTMPIVWGIPASKVFTAVWLIVLIADIVIIQLYVLHLGWWLSAIYSFGLIVFPLIIILKRLYEAQVSSDFHQLSKLIKLVMLTGILSMAFFSIYT